MILSREKPVDFEPINWSNLTNHVEHKFSMNQSDCEANMATCAKRGKIKRNHDQFWFGQKNYMKRRKLCWFLTTWIEPITFTWPHTGQKHCPWIERHKNTEHKPFIILQQQYIWKWSCKESCRGKKSLSHDSMLRLSFNGLLLIFFSFFAGESAVVGHLIWLSL